MRDSRRALLLVLPAVLTGSLVRAQRPPRDPSLDPDNPNPDDIRLPNGKRQIDEIIKADYERNITDARELTGLARSFEEDLEKNEAYVLSLASLKKLDDMEKLTKRIRARLKRA